MEPQGHQCYHCSLMVPCLLMINKTGAVCGSMGFCNWKIASSNPKFGRMMSLLGPFKNALNPQLLQVLADPVFSYECFFWVKVPAKEINVM